MKSKQQKRKSILFKWIFFLLLTIFISLVFDIHLFAQESEKTEPAKKEEVIAETTSDTLDAEDSAVKSESAETMLPEEVSAKDVPPKETEDDSIDKPEDAAEQEKSTEEKPQIVSAESAIHSMLFPESGIIEGTEITDGLIWPVPLDDSTESILDELLIAASKDPEKMIDTGEPMVAGISPPAPEDTSISELEDKLLAQIQAAYALRDIRLFKELKALFKTSFPTSSKFQEILVLESSFYYKDPLKTEGFAGNFVEIQRLSLNSWEELEAYFNKLKNLNVKGIYWPAAQFAGTPVLSFTKRDYAEGLFFKTGSVPQVNNSLEKVTKVAHQAGLKIYVSMPVRNHPWLLQTHPPILDEVFDPINKKTVIIPKLDLINPEAFKYFRELLDALLALPVDGVVFEDDFTYAVHEGFSPMARLLYEHETGKILDPSKLLKAYPQRDKTQMHVAFRKSYQKIAEWKLKKSHMIMMKILQYLKDNYQNAVVAVQTTAEMIMDSQIPLLWYATDMRSISSLPVDYFILNWRKFDHNSSTDPFLYEEAARYLQAMLNEDQELEVRIPLNDKTQYRIQFNFFSDKMLALTEKTGLKRLVIGPVDSADKLDFWTLK